MAWGLVIDGDRCVEHLQGMFAFALWDRSRRRLLLARDRLGIKPLYFALTARELLFASEIKAILAAGGVAPTFNEEILPEFLAARYVAGEDTFFKGIKSLAPGRTLSWSPDEGLAEHRYWHLPVTTDAGTGTFRERAEEVRTRLGEAVRSHLMSDVPLGLFLSGGIDSSGIAALMAPMMKEPLRTFAVGFEEPQASELGYAHLAARAVGAQQHQANVWCAGKRSDIRIASKIADRAVAGVDREDLAAEPMLPQIVDRPTRGLIGVARCPDDGDAARIHELLHGVHG